MPDRDTVIAMAIKAGFNPQECLSWQVEILRLAALVAAQEREQCALICESTAIAHNLAAFWGSEKKQAEGAKNCAASIRARKEET